jgi:IMP dehydrogenase
MKEWYWRYSIVDENQILKELLPTGICVLRNNTRPIVEVMTSENLVTVAEGTSLEQAEVVLQGHKMKNYQL